MARRLSPWFGAEAMLLIVLASFLILLEVGRTTAVSLIFAAWIAVAVLELLGSRGRAERRAAAEEQPAARRRPAGEDRQPVAGAEPFSPARRLAGRQEPQPLAVSPFDEAGPAPVLTAVTAAELQEPRQRKGEPER